MSHDLDIAEDVDRRGFSIVTVSGASPDFAYSVGLMFTLGHPELIVLGKSDTNSRIIRRMIDLLRSGRRFDARGEYDDILVNSKVSVRAVHPSQHEFYLGFAMGYCTNHGRSGKLEALQVFWPDKAGRFPYDRDCEESVWAAQTRLDQLIMPDVARDLRRR